MVGRANRLVMNKVKLVAAAFPIARFAPTRHVQGGADRQSAAARGRGAVGRALSDVRAPDGPLRLLVFGGSQGARALSEIVPAALTRLPHDMQDAPVGGAAMPPRRHRRRAHDLCQCRDPRRAADFLLRPAASAWPQAHLVIARSGAGTVAELMAIGRPAILVPLPGALDDNQTPNADILARGRCRLARRRNAILTPGSSGADADPDFRRSAWTWRSRAAAAHALATPDAAGDWRTLVEKLAEEGRLMATQARRPPAFRWTSAPSISSASAASA